MMTFDAGSSATAVDYFFDECTTCDPGWFELNNHSDYNYVEPEEILLDEKQKHERRLATLPGKYSRGPIIAGQPRRKITIRKHYARRRRNR